MIKDWLHHKIKGRPLVERFWEKVDIRGPDECWDWLAYKNKDGYGFFWLKGKHPSAHRVAWELTNGEIPEGMNVLHHCDNPSCCNPKCLFLGTHTGNMQDKSRKGRARGQNQKGNINNNAKLNEKQVLEIRILRQRGMIHREIAELYPISRREVGRICQRKRWQHI